MRSEKLIMEYCAQQWRHLHIYYISEFSTRIIRDWYPRKPGSKEWIIYFSRRALRVPKVVRFIQIWKVWWVIHHCRKRNSIDFIRVNVLIYGYGTAKRRLRNRAPFSKNLACYNWWKRRMLSLGNTNWRFNGRMVEMSVMIDDWLQGKLIASFEVHIIFCMEGNMFRAKDVSQ